jgi:hypothetical protein
MFSIYGFHFFLLFFWQDAVCPPAAQDNVILSRVGDLWCSIAGVADLL